MTVFFFRHFDRFCERFAGTSQSEKNKPQNQQSKFSGICGRRGKITFRTFSSPVLSNAVRAMVQELHRF